MKGYYTIIKYYPDIQKNEGFGIGLILIELSGEVHIKSSTQRINRINSAFGINKSKLLEIALKEITKDKGKIDLIRINYLSKYENGIIRYDVPKVVIADNLSEKFEILYEKFVADYNELTEPNKIKKIRLGSRFRMKLESDYYIKDRVSINYSFDKNALTNFFFNNTSIDFIGGNGNIFCGEILNLDNEENTIKQNFHKTISIFDALEKKYSKIGKFDPRDCKILLDKKQVEKKESAQYMDILNTWHKTANYDLIIEDKLDNFVDRIRNQIRENNIIPFDEWNRKILLGEKLS